MGVVPPAVAVRDRTGGPLPRSVRGRGRAHGAAVRQPCGADALLPRSAPWHTSDPRVAGGRSVTPGPERLRRAGAGDRRQSHRAPRGGPGGGRGGGARRGTTTP